MTNNYETIHFEAFLKEPVRDLTETEKQVYISNFYESIGRGRKSASARKSSGGVSRRRMLLFAASLTMILAFGAVAGAAGWLELGQVNGNELSAIRDSAPHKAEKAIEKYYSGFSKEELIAFDVARWGNAFEDTGTYDAKTHSITYSAPTKKTREILDKYQLDYERTHYYVNSAKEVFAQAGIGNILGDFKDIDDLVLTDGEDVYCGAYVYTDQGSALLSGGGGSPRDPYWELRVTPRNVYAGEDTFASSQDKSCPQYAQWDFLTKDGIPVKATSRLDKQYDAKGRETTIRDFQALLFTGDYKVMFFYSVELPSSDLSNQEFEALVEKLDFSKLS